MDTIRGNVMRDAPVNDPGFVGIASELAQYDAKYKDIFENLLGRTVIAEAMTDAIRISKNNGQPSAHRDAGRAAYKRRRLNDRRQQRKGARA